jgi:hypothetical protein
MEAAFANKIPKAGVEQPPKRLRTTPLICDFNPLIAIKKGYVPLDYGAEFRVVARLRTSEAAIGNVKIKARMNGRSTKNRSCILDDMRRNY